MNSHAHYFKLLPVHCSLSKCCLVLKTLPLLQQSDYGHDAVHETAASHLRHNWTPAAILQWGGLSWSRLTWPIQSGSPEFSLFPSGCGFAVGLILLLLSHNTLVPCGDSKDFSNSNSSDSSVLTETKTNRKFSRGTLKFHSHTFRHSALEGHCCPLQ